MVRTKHSDQHWIVKSICRYNKLYYEVKHVPSVKYFWKVTGPHYYRIKTYEFISGIFSYIQEVAHKYVRIQHRIATIISLCPENVIQSEENSAHHGYRHKMEDIKLRFLLYS
jgi:hypothetical protein